MRFNRRFFLRTTTAAATACIAGRDMLAAEGELVPATPYKRANTDWLAQCRFGIGIHWTAQTVPRSGQPKPFQKAVDDFDLDGFIKRVEQHHPKVVARTSIRRTIQLSTPPSAFLT